MSNPVTTRHDLVTCSVFVVRGNRDLPAPRRTFPPEPRDCTAQSPRPVSSAGNARDLQDREGGPRKPSGTPGDSMLLITILPGGYLCQSIDEGPCYYVRKNFWDPAYVHR